MPITAEHGHDMSGTTAQRPTNAEHGATFYDTSFNNLFWWNGFCWEAHGGPGTNLLYDDFLGDVLAAEWSASQGSDAEGAIAAIVAGAQSGEVKLTAGDSNDINAISCLTQGLGWALTAGKLVFEAKVNLGSAASVAGFIGMSDVLATTTKEETASLSGTTLTTAATDAFGFLYDTAATNDFWHTVGVATDVDRAHTSTGILPVANTYATFRIEVTAAGVATFKINGTSHGTLGTAAAPVCAIATKLTPSLYVNGRTTATKTMVVDYIKVYQELAA